MHSIGKAFKLIFLGIMFIFLSVGYKLLGHAKDSDSDDGDTTLFGAKIANADVAGGGGGRDSDSDSY